MNSSYAACPRPVVASTPACAVQPRPACQLPRIDPRPTPYQPVCPVPDAPACQLVDDTRQTYNMSVKPTWKILIIAVVIIFIVVLVALILGYFLHNSTVHELELIVPTTVLTVTATFGDTVYTSTTTVLGGDFYETTTPTISSYATTVSSVLAGTVANGTNIMNGAGTFTYNTQTSTFTISLNRASTLTVQSSDTRYWHALGFGVSTTITLSDMTMTSLTSAPIRVQPDVQD